MGSIQQQARQAIDGKTKPPGSLGMLEDWAERCARRRLTFRPDDADALQHAQIQQYSHQAVGAVASCDTAPGLNMRAQEAAWLVDRRRWLSKRSPVDVHSCTRSYYSSQFVPLTNSVSRCRLSRGSASRASAPGMQVATGRSRDYACAPISAR